MTATPAARGGGTTELSTPEGPFVFRLNDNGLGPHLLVQVMTCDSCCCSCSVTKS